MRTHLVALFVLALTLLPRATEAAPGAGGTAKAEAKAIAATGYQLYEEGRYDEAIAELEKAERIYHAPTLVFAIGQAHAQKGRLLEARACFLTVAAEKLAAGAPKPFKEAQVRAKAELASLARRIPTMTVQITGAVERKSTIVAGGVLLEDGEIGRSLERNPGRYTIVVDLLGGAELSRIVDLKEGSKEQVTIDIPAPVVNKSPEVKPPPVAVPGAEVRAAPKVESKVVPAMETKKAEPSRRGSLVPSLVSLGVGAAGLGVGIWSGAATLVNAGILKPLCTGNACKPNTADLIERTKTLSVVSTAAFVVAGAGAATGVTLLVLRSKRKAPASVEIHAGPALVTITGVF